MGHRINPVATVIIDVSALRTHFQFLSIYYNGKINLELCQFQITRPFQEYTFGMKLDYLTPMFHSSERH